ncbi:hypothetical protein P9112_004519 [Eukaryota sp. TZLM1-RC]
MNGTSETTDSRLCDTPPLPERFQNPTCFQYPESKTVHPLYRTSNSQYGSMPPNTQAMPLVWNGRTGDFTKTFNGGVYRNNALNTAVSRNPVCDKL